MLLKVSILLQSLCNFAPDIEWQKLQNWCHLPQQHMLIIVLSQQPGSLAPMLPGPGHVHSSQSLTSQVKRTADDGGEGESTLTHLLLLQEANSSSNSNSPSSMPFSGFLVTQEHHIKSQRLQVHSTTPVCQSHFLLWALHIWNLLQE